MKIVINYASIKLVDTRDIMRKMKEKIIIDILKLSLAGLTPSHLRLPYVPSVSRDKHLENSCALRKGHHARRMSKQRPDPTRGRKRAVPAAARRQTRPNLRGETVPRRKCRREERLGGRESASFIAVVQLLQQSPRSQPKLRPQGNGL
jgi:hypothetical protein